MVAMTVREMSLSEVICQSSKRLGLLSPAFQGLSVIKDGPVDLVPETSMCSIIADKERKQIIEKTERIVKTCTISSDLSPYAVLIHEPAIIGDGSFDMNPVANRRIGRLNQDFSGPARGRRSPHNVVRQEPFSEKCTESLGNYTAPGGYQ
jgi:hypothetical protein